MTVAELFDRVLPRLVSKPPVLAFVDAVQAVQEVISRRLWEHGSDLLKSPWTSETQLAGTSEVTLPGDMLGVMSDTTRDPPFITYTSSGATQIAPLYPLEGSRANYVLKADAIPEAYEIRSTTFELFPGSSVAFTLTVPMFRRPAPITSMSSTLPWGGMHDQLFQDAVLYMGGPEGAWMAAVTPGLELAIKAAVDSGTAIRTGRRVRWLMA